MTIIFMGHERLSVHYEWFVRAYRLLKNWPAVFLQKFRIPVFRDRVVLRLRDDTYFVTGLRVWGIDDLTAVWLDGVYGDLKYLMGVRNATIIDVGAHLGAFSVFAAKTLSESRIFAYEPNPEVLRYFADSIGANGFGARVVVLDQAVAGKSGQRELLIDKLGGVSSSFFGDKKRAFGGSVSVRCVTLDDIFRQHGIERCDLLKMNCEGAEYEILENTSPEVLSRIGHMVLQWHMIEGRDKRELESLLVNNGFTVRYAAAPYRFLFADRCG